VTAMKNRTIRPARVRATRWLGAALTLAAALPATAAEIEVALGNTASGLIPGSEVSIFEIMAAQDGQPAPFDQGYGSDPIENFTATWTFEFAPVADPIAAASILIGLYDADAGSPGSQVDSFEVAGNDLTAVADAAFELAGGASSVYDVYSVNLGSVLASLAGGSVSVTLRLMGPVESPVLVPPPDLEIDGFNGAALIHSTLRITTRRPPIEVPEPAGMWLIGSGLLALAATRRRRTDLTRINS